jgi:hypothetical protein
MALDLTGQVVDNLLLSKVEASLGTYRDSDLDVVTFNTQNMGTWMLCDGQDCSSTEYFGLTGKTNVPDFLTQGTFRRQAKVGRSLGTYEADELKSHTHSYVKHVNTGGGSGPSLNQTPAGATTGATGGSETRPKNYSCNVFMKVSHT